MICLNELESNILLEKSILFWPIATCEMWQCSTRTNFRGIRKASAPFLAWRLLIFVLNRRNCIEVFPCDPFKTNPWNNSSCKEQGETNETFEECKSQGKLQPMFAYWSKVLELGMIMLQMIHSIRSADSDHSVKALALLVPWFFSFDHTHYARWLSVHLRDLCQLEKMPAVYQAFLNGNFALNKQRSPSHP